MRWLYRRIGQITSFTLGGLFAFVSLYGMMPAAVMALGFFGLALYLRHQMLESAWYISTQNPPQPDTLIEWWQKLTPEQQEAINEIVDPSE